MMNAFDLKKMAQLAKTSTLQMAKSPLKQRHDVLEAMIKNLEDRKDQILKANLEDIAIAKCNGLQEAMLERLSLENKIEGIIHDLQQVILLSDPLGQLSEEKILPNQLSLAKYRTPIGVLGIIYESRPNVTIDISALAIKSGNCALLRGGSESLHTNQLLIELIQKSLREAGLPSEIIQLIACTDRSQVKEMLQLHEYIDLIIPRGSLALQEFCRNNSTIPVITGGIGICHLFVDETADLERSMNVIINAKTQRPNVCNALDTLLIHSAIAHEFIPAVIEILSAKGIIFKLDQKGWNLFHNLSCQLATAKDWDTEWLSLVLGIKVVENLDEAIDHIRLHSTQHSDGILTANSHNAERFSKEVDSAVVYINASTRFTDGGQFGFGSEVAISTQKLHARGPMGLNELTSYKWLVRGDYQIRT